MAVTVLGKEEHARHGHRTMNVREPSSRETKCGFFSAAGGPVGNLDMARRDPPRWILRCLCMSKGIQVFAFRLFASQELRKLAKIQCQILPSLAAKKVFMDTLFTVGFDRSPGARL